MDSCHRSRLPSDAAPLPRVRARMENEELTAIVDQIHQIDPSFDAKRIDPAAARAKLRTLRAEQQTLLRQLREVLFNSREESSGGAEQPCRNAGRGCLCWCCLRFCGEVWLCAVLMLCGRVLARCSAGICGFYPLCSTHLHRSLCGAVRLLRYPAVL